MLSSGSGYSPKEQKRNESSTTVDDSYVTNTLVYSIGYNYMTTFVGKIWSDSSSSLSYAVRGRLKFPYDAKLLMNNSENRLFTVQEVTSQSSPILLAIDN